MSNHLPRFVPASEPSYYTSGKGLTLKAEFSRTVTIVCAACEVTKLPLKLLSNSVLRPDTCERLLTDYLDTLGWGRLKQGGADICPECINTDHDVCPHCRLFGGGHTKGCITQLPGSLL
jgi:hypothetical protein